MISRWLSHDARSPNDYNFVVIDVLDGKPIDPSELVDYLSTRLVDGLVSPERLSLILERAGLAKLLAVLRDRVVNRRLSVLIGDFGEIVAAEMLKEFDQYVIPIAKLRFREKRNWPMRLTDVFGFKHDGGHITELCLCEAKTRTRWNVECEEVGLEACRELEKEAMQRIPEIVEFVGDKLLLEGNFELVDLLDSFLLADDPGQFPRHCTVVLLFDSGIWQETVLARIADEDISLPDLSVKAVRVAQLRHLIDGSYARVVEKYHG